MHAEQATSAQRVGVFLALVEAGLLTFVATLHFGVVLHVGTATFAAPPLYPAAIIEVLLALALVTSVALPGGGTVRAGRVLAAQILTMSGLFASQVALMRGVALTTVRNEVFYGAIFVLAFVSVVAIASPSYRGRPVAH